MLHKKMATFTAAELQQRRFPPIAFVVDPYIVEGLTILAGRPKLGKSWLVLDIALSVACGGPAFGSIPCEQGSVLYACLEDNPRRIQRRTQQLMGDVADWPESLTFTHALPRLDEGGIEELEMWRQSVSKPRLIIIDTLQKVRAVRRNNDGIYDSDYQALIPLQEWASQHGIAVIAVHHTRKAEADDPLDTVSGSTGLTGAADTIVVLHRDSGGVVLVGRGRDIDEFETAVKLDQTTGQWSILGKAADVRRSDERKCILEALMHGKASVGELMAATGMARNNIDVLLYKMAKAGEIERVGRGSYSLYDPSKNDKTVRNWGEAYD
ncbi:hypothetical protein FHS85_004794 [Rhodoligotrophos appendicifer]|uniref:AAA family ATPase n=1 Tax=Rhodoligotrophos appendicifer TaxID=987056 RepID=UPI00147940E7|nr:AAA family ATPase [Rhodoligotrophos appendicifer]